MQQSSNKSLILIITLIILALCFPGCSAIVSPYNAEFQCPETDKGKCVSVQTAYKESIDNPLVKADPDSLPKETANKSRPPCETCGGTERKGPKQSEEHQLDTIPKSDAYKSGNPKHQYQDALYRKLASLIGQPSTPVVVPPDVVRVLILSYTGSENDLFSYRYVYFFATEPSWIISTAKEAD
jgi:conjugal transfer pilus assembly protein TraV